MRLGSLPSFPLNLNLVCLQLRLAVLAAAAAAAVVVVRLSSQSASPAEALGWGRDAFGLYNYGAPRAQQQVAWCAVCVPCFVGSAAC